MIYFKFTIQACIFSDFYTPYKLPIFEKNIRILAYAVPIFIKYNLYLTNIWRQKYILNIMLRLDVCMPCSAIMQNIIMPVKSYLTPVRANSQFVKMIYVRFFITMNISIIFGINLKLTF